VHRRENNHLTFESRGEREVTHNGRIKREEDGFERTFSSNDRVGTKKRSERKLEHGQGGVGCLRQIWITKRQK